MIHGADILSYKTDRDLIDFSSNINPLGYPDGLKEFMFSEFDNVKAYPDIKYRELRASIANYLGVNSDNIVPGNGAMEIIDGVLKRFDRCIIPYPSFIEYELRAVANECKTQFIPPRDDLSLNFREMYNAISKTTENTCVILGNPNNPTGYVLSLEDIKKLHSHCKEHKATLILDEAFFEFADLDYNTVDLAIDVDFENIIIVRAATKFFGLPGIRLGYGIMSEENVINLNDSLNPWSINSFAESAGRYIFNDDSYINDTIKYINNERDYLISELRELNAFEIYEYHSNYLLLRLIAGNTDELFKYLLQSRILIRLCSTFRGLDNSYIRIAVRSHEDNKYLIKTLKEFYHGK